MIQRSTWKHCLGIISWKISFLLFVRNQVSPERICVDCFKLAWRILGKIAHKFVSAFFGEFFPQIFRPRFSRVSGTPKIHPQAQKFLHASPISDLSGPILRDIARLSHRYPPYCALWGFWCLNMANGCDTPSPFLRASSSESMRSGGAIPPPPTRGVSQRYLRDTL